MELLWFNIMASPYRDIVSNTNNNNSGYFTNPPYPMSSPTHPSVMLDAIVQADIFQRVSLIYIRTSTPSMT